MDSLAVLSALTVPKLKEKCRELGIPVGGKKADLIARIQSAQEDPELPVPVPVQANKATTKRKLPAKNPSYTSDKQGSGGKKMRVSGTPEMMDTTPIAAKLPASHPVPELSSILTNTTVVEKNLQVTSSVQSVATGAIRRNGKPVEGLSPQTTATHGPQDQFEPFRTPNYITSSADLITSQADVSPESGKDTRTTRREIPEANVPSVSIAQGITCINHTVPLPQPNRETIRNGGLSEAHEPPLPQNRVAAQMKSVPCAFKDLPSKPGRERLGIAPSVSLTVDRNSNGKRASATKPTPRQFRGLPSIFTAKSPALQPGGNSTPIFGASQSAMSGLAGGIDHCRNSARSENTNATTAQSTSGLPPRAQDHEISVSIIRNPPRYSLRRQVEIVARVLALTAFYGFTPHANSSVHGDFLNHFVGLSRNYRYASTLAFTYLTKIEFPGKRTERWFKAKRIDEKVADIRPWYWYRVTERTKVIEQLRTSWMERVWRFLMMASAPGTSSLPTGIGPARFGLWFGGVSQHLLADPDLQGQFETAIRFWIRRFYVWVTRSGGGYPQLLGDLQEEMVQEIQPLDENISQDLWRLVTRCGSVHFIVGMTGEVVGWVEADGTIGGGPGSVRQRRAKTSIGTMSRTRTGSSEANRKNQANMGNTWQDLRGDWREHASALLSPPLSSKGTESLLKGLLKCVYRPDSKPVSHGIHESVKLPHHRLLAGRWVLAHVEPGGISGKPVLDVPHGQAHRKEKIVLDLQAKLTVESVRCSGEKWSSSMKGVLAQGLAFVQTPGMGWFVLEETGQNIAQEEYGIQGLWATVLGVSENGAKMSAEELESLAGMFVWRSPEIFEI